jgi:DNA-binding MarR family transcriptional regulator
MKTSKGGTYPRAAVNRDAYLSILQAAETLQRQVVELLKRSDLSLAQYNVLRILRGAGPAGASCGAIGERLIRHDPDITRLVDRLEKRGLIERTRDARDRRIVRTRISAAGLALLAELDEPMDALHDRQLGHIGEGRLTELTTLLQDARIRNA